MPESVFIKQTAETMRRHRELQSQSGLTIEAYCKRENISPSSWWSWRKRLLSKKLIADHSGQAPVSFLQIPTQQQIPENQKIDITCLMVRGFPCQYPASLLFYARPSTCLPPCNPGRRLDVHATFCRAGICLLATDRSSQEFR